MNTTLAGREGEAAAAAYLRKKRYEVIGANYRCRFGELDLIAKKQELVIFVEVKLRKAAASWMASHECEAPARFDVIEVYTETGRINHIENAFE